ncbi:MAG: hypothetical protein ACRCX2_37255, partial [Paraclostridium sp.]
MSKKFNPGFDREKAAFIELANRGEGLTPINYLYANEAGFESVLASYYKGGVIDVNMLYAVNIKATDIVTKTIEAKIATIDTAYITNVYSENIYNKEKITTKDLFVSHDLTVGSVTSLATITFHPSLFEVAGAVASFDLGAFTVIAGIMSFTDATSFSVNSPLVSINYVEGALKVGAVGIYSGGLIDINASKIQIGDPTKLGVKTLSITMKPTISMDISTASFSTIAQTAIKIETPDMTITGYPEEFFTKIKIDSNDFLILTQSLGELIFKDTNIGANFELANLELCKIAANYLTIDTTSDTDITSSVLKINATTVDINGTNTTIAGTSCSIAQEAAIGLTAESVNVNAEGTISLNAALISVDSPETIPGIPIPIVGEGVLVAAFVPPLPVSGELIFT